MKIIDKTIQTVIIAGIVATLIVFGTPAFSYNAEHQHQQVSNQLPNDSFGVNLPTFHHRSAIDLSNKDISAGGYANSNLLASKKIAAKPAAVRKNVVDLTSEEKQAFVKAVQTLKNTVPTGSKLSIYDQYVAVHVEAMELMSEGARGPAAGHDGAHESNLILPWHRELIRRFERSLQAVDPSVTLPYWDWTDAKALDVIFKDDFMGPNGKGKTVNIPNAGNFEGGPVPSGPFAAGKWVINPNLHLKPSGESLGNVLLRFLRLPPVNNYPIPQADVAQILALDDYDTFRLAIEGFIKPGNQGQPPTQGVFMHNYFHSFVGGATFDPAVGRPDPVGTMASLAASINDPVFWFVHSNVDRLWAEWQEDGHAGEDYYPATGGHYGENLNDRLWPWDGGESSPANLSSADVLSLLPAFSPNDIVTPADTLDFQKYGYSYDTLGSKTANNQLKQKQNNSVS